MSHSADLYQAFFHTAGDAIFVFDAATKDLVETNAQALNDTGYRSEEIRGLAIDRLFRPQNGLNCPAFSRNPDEAGRLRGDSVRLVRKSGETIAVNVSIAPVKWGDAAYLFVTARTTSATLPCVSSATENSAAWSEHEDFPSIIGQSEKIREVCRLIGSVAKSEVTVLIQGESGTGKEIVANAIHAHSHRCRGSFVKVNCAALTDTLLESELLRSRERRFHGRDPGPPWTVQTGRGWHDSLGRGWQYAALGTGEATSGPAGARVRAGWQLRDHAGQCPGHCRDQCGPRKRSRRRHIS